MTPSHLSIFTKSFFIWLDSFCLTGLLHLNGLFIILGVGVDDAFVIMDLRLEQIEQIAMFVRLQLLRLAAPIILYKLFDAFQDSNDTFGYQDSQIVHRFGSGRTSIWSWLRTLATVLRQDAYGQEKAEAEAEKRRTNFSSCAAKVLHFHFSLFSTLSTGALCLRQSYWTYHGVFRNARVIRLVTSGKNIWQHLTKVQSCLLQPTMPPKLACCLAWFRHRPPQWRFFGWLRWLASFCISDGSVHGMVWNIFLCAELHGPHIPCGLLQLTLHVFLCFPVFSAVPLVTYSYFLGLSLKISLDCIVAHSEDFISHAPWQH